MNSIKSEKLKVPIITAIVMLLSLVVFVHSYVKVRTMVEALCYERLVDYTIAAEKDISSLFSYNGIALDIAAEHFSTLDSLDDDQAIKLLNDYSDEIRASRVSVILPDDRIVTIKGVLEPTTLKYDDIAPLGRHFSHRDNSRLYSEQVIFRQYVPIIRDGKTIGVIYAVYFCDEISQLIDFSFYEGQANFNMVDRRDGMVLANSYTHIYSNVNEQAHTKLVKGGYFDPKKILNGESGVFLFKGEETGRNLFCSYGPTDYKEFAICIGLYEDVPMAKLYEYRRVINILAIAEDSLLFAYICWILRRNKKSIEKISDFSNKDVLTGVGSIFLYSHDTAELDKLIGEGTAPPFAVVECDLNSLKEFNDNFGHDAGNEYIRGCCEIISGAFPNSKTYRIGGDEFVLILRDKDYENRDYLFKKLLATRVVKKGRRLSFASGMSDFNPEKDQAVADVLKRADKLMYENKEKIKAQQKNNKK